MLRVDKRAHACTRLGQQSFRIQIRERTTYSRVIQSAERDPPSTFHQSAGLCPVGSSEGLKRDDQNRVAAAGPVSQRAAQPNTTNRRSQQRRRLSRAARQRDFRACHSQTLRLACLAPRPHGTVRLLCLLSFAPAQQLLLVHLQGVRDQVRRPTGALLASSRSRSMRARNDGAAKGGT